MISNKRFLSFAHGGLELPRAILPHEKKVIDSVTSDLEDSQRTITQAKQDVSGGDDWHDGAFRVTDNASELLRREYQTTVAPYLGSLVVDYPHITAEEVTLGSRVWVSIDGLMQPFDIVGFRHSYPEVTDFVTGEPVTAITPESPLLSSVMGAKVGTHAVRHINGRAMEIDVLRLDQQAVAELFRSEENVN
jgi:hypothetical protein